MTFAESVGWVLVHFIWQGAAIAAALWLVLTLTPPRRAMLRYAWGCSALLLMLAAPIVTATQVVRASPRLETALRGAAPGAVATMGGAVRGEGDGEVEKAARASGGRVPGDVRDGALASDGRRTRAFDSQTPVASSITLAWTLTPTMRARVAAVMPWLVVVWAVGVMFLSVRLAGGWWRTRRLRTQDVAVVPASCQQAAARLVARLRVTRPVVFLVSTRVRVPMVFGHVKPVVLLPVAALAGLSPSQLEAILAHELAHVRRHDYLVNLVQTVIETLLFYHPAVWWVSTQVRIAREHCCDDIAVAACDDRKGYVEALLGLEQIRHASPALALGATDGPLLARARRILQDRERDGTSPRLAAGVIAMVVAAVAMASISTASNEPMAGKARLDASRVSDAAVPREPSETSAATRRSGQGPGAPMPPPRPVIAAADQTGTLASRRAWAEREARTRRAGRYWLGYAIRRGAALPPVVYLDSHGLIIGDRMQFSGHVLSRDAAGLRYPGQPLAIAGGDPSAIKLLFAYDARRGSPQLTSVHGSTLPLPVDVKDQPVFWVGSVEAAQSLELIDGLYGGASTTQLRKDLIAAAAVHDDSPAVVAWLDRRVRSGEADEVRADAAEWIAWHPIPAALTALERAARQDGASRVRQEAAEALGDLALPEAATTLIALAKSLDDRDARREAVEALGARPEIPARDALGAIARQDADLDIQREAVETLGDYNDRRGVPLLLDLLRTHAQADVRREALETLSDHLPPADALGLLREVIHGEADTALRIDAVERLADIKDAGVKTELFSLARTHTSEDVRAEAVETLADLTPAPEIADVLKKIAHEEPTARVRNEAIETLADLADGAGVPALVEIARAHPDPHARREALDALADSKHPRAREIFERVLSKPSGR